MRSKRRLTALAATCVLALCLTAGCTDRDAKKKGGAADGNPGEQKTETVLTQSPTEAVTPTQTEEPTSTQTPTQKPEDPKANPEDPKANPVAPQDTSTMTGVLIPLEDKNITTVRYGNREYTIDTTYLTNFTTTEYGILYNTARDPEDNAYTMDYYLMDPQTGTSEKLGSVEHVGRELNDKAAVIENKVYIPVYMADPFVLGKPTVLLEIDVEKKTLTQHTITESGFMYGSIEAFNNKLVLNLTDASEPQKDRIFEYDPATAEVREVMSVLLSRQGSSKAYRGLYNDNGTLCVLTARYEDDRAQQLVIERYDADYKLVGEWDITDITKAFLSRYPYDPEDVEGEFRQFMYRFEIVDGRYLYFENASTTRYIADLGTDPDAYFANKGAAKFVELNGVMLQQFGSGNCFVVPWFEDEPGEYTGRYFKIEDGELTEIKMPEPFFRIVGTERAESIEGDGEGDGEQTGVFTGN